MKISLEIATKLAKKFNLNLSVVSLKEWHYGLNVELEHTDITRNSLKKTAMIALAHLKEYPDYYKFLHKLESSREKYWKTRTKPSIFHK